MIRRRIRRCQVWPDTASIAIYDGPIEGMLHLDRMTSAATIAGIAQIDVTMADGRRCTYTVEQVQPQLLVADVPAEDD